ncbi:MAG: transcriptional repressor [Deltaproteobacteria bacterium]|nr:transcriptional repressor [Deltaproteobacteria bacterium]
MKNTKNAIMRFRKFLAMKGLRFTEEREKIVKYVFDEHRHFRVDAIIERMRNGKERTSRATVYRALPLLLESGLVREAGRRDGETYYEHIFEHRHHDHLVCDNCHSVVEFYYDAIEVLQQSVAAQYGFNLTGHLLTLRGLCNSCRSERRDETTIQ